MVDDIPEHDHDPRLEILYITSEKACYVTSKRVENKAKPGAEAQRYTNISLRNVYRSNEGLVKGKFLSFFVLVIVPILHCPCSCSRSL